MTGRIAAAQLAMGGLLMLNAGGAAAANNVTATPPPKKAAIAVPASGAPISAPVVTSLPTYRRYVHPHAKAMAGIDLTRITASPLGKKFAAQFEALDLKKKAAAEGMDFVSDIEKLMLSTPGEAGAAEGSAKLSEDAPFVVAMQGRFKIDALRKSLMARKAARLVHQGAEVWMPPKGDTSLAIVNAQLMLIGDRKSLRATLDAQAAVTEGAGDDGESNPVIERAAELAGQYDVWLVSEASLEGIGKSTPVPQGEMLNGVDRFELGVSLRQGLQADVSLHGRTPEDTSKLGTMLAGVKALAAMATDRKKDPGLAAMLDKLKIGTDGDSVVVSAQFSQKELDRGVESILAARSGVAVKPPVEVAAAALPVKPAALPAPPPAPLLVRIYNAEGGTREIPLSR